ncbi:MAG: hypothetical protein KGI45_00690 [Patescibacteria group bacterium]|nr:hypothetical protein [Patescibacteria group bacterium]MDE1940513.1 hypothetical protein [Patescibacteria group bacterium]MDE1966579.1 hypothetical protein [Patescibacteria group bacterium]
MKHRGHYLFLVFAILVFLTCFSVYVYMYHWAAVAVDKSFNARAAVAAAISNSSRDQAFMDQYKASAPDWQKMSGYFVPADDVVSFIEAIEGLDKGSGATTTISAISADNISGSPAGTIGNFHATVSGSGSWPSVMRAIELAENLPFVSSVSGVKVNVSDAGTAKKSWDFTMSITAKMAVPVSTSTQI